MRCGLEIDSFEPESYLLGLRDNFPSRIAVKIYKWPTRLFILILACIIARFANVNMRNARGNMANQNLSLRLGQIRTLKASMT